MTYGFVLTPFWRHIPHTKQSILDCILIGLYVIVLSSYVRYTDVKYARSTIGKVPVAQETIEWTAGCQWFF